MTPKASLYIENTQKVSKQILLEENQINFIQLKQV